MRQNVIGDGEFDPVAGRAQTGNCKKQIAANGALTGNVRRDFLRQRGRAAPAAKHAECHHRAARSHRRENIAHVRGGKSDQIGVEE